MRSMKMLCLIIPSLIMAKSVTFDEALQLSLQNNHELKAKKLEVDKAKASLQEAKGSELGVLKFNENISRTNHAGYVFGMKMGQRQATFGDFGFDIHAMSLMTPPTMNDFMQTAPNALNNPEAVTNYETKLTYEIPLFAGFKIQNAKTMMELQIKANEFRYKADEKTLALEVLKAYNGAVAAKQFIKATKMAKEATNAFVHFADEMFKEGFTTKIDVKQAEAYDLDVDAKTIEAKNSFDLAIAYLKFLSDDTDISDVSDFKNFDILQANLQDLQRNALQNREDLNWMNLNKETAKVNYGPTKREIHFLPVQGNIYQIVFASNGIPMGTTLSSVGYNLPAVGSPAPNGVVVSAISVGNTLEQREGLTVLNQSLLLRGFLIWRSAVQSALYPNPNLNTLLSGEVLLLYDREPDQHSSAIPPLSEFLEFPGTYMSPMAIDSRDRFDVLLRKRVTLPVATVYPTDNRLVPSRCGFLDMKIPINRITVYKSSSPNPTAPSDIRKGGLYLYFLGDWVNTSADALMFRGFIKLSFVETQ